jgi:nucleotide-binding universal stress UspA family protein
VVSQPGAAGGTRRLSAAPARLQPIVGLSYINPDAVKGSTIHLARKTLFAHLKEPAMFKRILVPTDGSDITQKAVATAVALAKSLGATLFTLSVKEPFPYSAISEMQPVPPQEFFDAQERIASERINTVRESCQLAGLACEAHTIEAVHPWEAIIEHATSHGCDLIVMSSHGRRGVTALLLGSETQKVLTHTTIPVLVVR